MRKQRFIFTSYYLADWWPPSCVNSVSYRQTRPFRIVTGGEDLLVNFYEGPPFKYKHNLREHDRYPNVVRFSPDGAQFASVGSDYKVHSEEA